MFLMACRCSVLFGEFYLLGLPDRDAVLWCADDDDRSVRVKRSSV